MLQIVLFIDSYEEEETLKEHVRKAAESTQVASFVDGLVVDSAARQLQSTAAARDDVSEDDVLPVSWSRAMLSLQYADDRLSPVQEEEPEQETTSASPQDHENGTRSRSERRGKVQPSLLWD